MFIFSNQNGATFQNRFEPEIAPKPRFKPGLPDFSWRDIPKWQQNVPKWLKNVPKWLQNVPNGSKKLQMAIKYINMFHSKAFQNIPKL
jgi:hypothetical protein